MGVQEKRKESKSVEIPTAAARFFGTHRKHARFKVAAVEHQTGKTACCDQGKKMNRDKRDGGDLCEEECASQVSLFFQVPLACLSSHHRDKGTVRTCRFPNSTRQIVFFTMSGVYAFSRTMTLRCFGSTISCLRGDYRQLRAALSNVNNCESLVSATRPAGPAFGLDRLDALHIAECTTAFGLRKAFHLSRPTVHPERHVCAEYSLEKDVP